MFPPDIDIIPTFLAVALLYRKIHESNFDESYCLAIPKCISIPTFTGKAIGAETLAHQREEGECLVGTFCKYNILLRNLPLYYRMFPQDIDRLPKLTTLVEVVSDKKLKKLPVITRLFLRP